MPTLDSQKSRLDSQMDSQVVTLDSQNDQVTIQKSHQKKSQGKKRLGRGLGSLLGPGTGAFTDSTLDSQMDSQVVTLDSQNDHLTIQSGHQLPSQSERSKALKPEGLRAEASGEGSSDVLEKINPNKNLDPSIRIWNLAIEKVFPNQTQPRKDFLREPLEELGKSIGEQGVIQPITVRKKGDGYEIIAGERRWRASQMVGLKEIPAIIKNVNDQKSMELALIENLQREDLNPVEEAMGYQVLIQDYQLSQQELATKVGKSRSAITNSLRLLNLPRDIQLMLRQGLISFGHAKVLLGVTDPKRQVLLARQTLKKKLSVRALEKEVASRPKAAPTPALAVHDRLVQELATDLQRKLGTKVHIKYGSGKGRIEIAFYSDEELNSLVEKIKS